VVTGAEGKKDLRPEVLRSMLDAAHDLVYAKDLDGVYLACNPASERLLGLTESEQVGKTDRDFFSPGFAEAVRRDDLAVLASGQERRTEEWVTYPDGRRALMESIKVPFFGADGSVAGLVGVSRDITAQRSLQAQIALSSRLAALGTLVAGVAHEVNNPLAAILANQGLALELARESRNAIRATTPIVPDLRVGDLDELVELLAEAQESGQRIAQIVRDMATFANPEPARALVRLSHVVERAMRRFSSATGQSAMIQVDDGGAPEVTAASGQLEKVVHNLITNAVRASSGTEGTIVVRTGPGSPSMARLEVIDRGIGIPEAAFERIFEPFYTTHPAGEGHGAGLGLGSVAPSSPRTVAPSRSRARSARAPRSRWSCLQHPPGREAPFPPYSHRHALRAARTPFQRSELKIPVSLVRIGVQALLRLAPTSRAPPTAGLAGLPYYGGRGARDGAGGASRLPRRDGIPSAPVG
jgi:PAS domain S-box-containing protein